MGENDVAVDVDDGNRDGYVLLDDSASTRSAISFAIVSRSMVVCFLSERAVRISALAVEAQLSHVEPESIFRVSNRLEPLRQKRF